MKLNGANAQKKLEEACALLKCTLPEFNMSVSAAIRNANRIPCPPEDAGCLSKELPPYIHAVLSRHQTRLPLTYIAGTGQRPLPPPQVRKDHHARESAISH